MTIQIHSKEGKTYIVMGCPNSATSFISKLLEMGGVKMGNVKRGFHKDFYEDPDFLNLNKLMIREPKKDWTQEIKQLIKRKKADFWGWKDPRTAFTIGKYLPHLGSDVYLICCFRKPEKILKSWKGKYNKKLIDSYNKAIIKSLKKFCELDGAKRGNKKKKVN